MGGGNGYAEVCSVVPLNSVMKWRFYFLKVFLFFFFLFSLPVPCKSTTDFLVMEAFDLWELTLGQDAWK